MVAAFDGSTMAISTGFLFGLGLILSVGPQNLRLIEAGFTRQHIASVATTGYLSEIVVVTVGVAGLGSLLLTAPGLADVLRMGGIAFLLWYGARALRAGRSAIGPSGAMVTSRREAIVSMLAVTWLNPLVYLEALLLVAALSTSFSEAARAWFAAGFLAASAIKFYGWSCAGRLLSPLLAQPARRQLFDRLSGVLLIAAAGLIALQTLHGA